MKEGKREETVERLSRTIEKTFTEAFHDKDKVGILFSGGVDSALMATLAQRTSEPQLYSTGVSGCKDLKSAQKVASKLNLELEVIELGEDDILSLLKTASEILDEFDVLNLELSVPLAACAELARGQDKSYLAMGQGAEELFAGYRRHERAYKEGEDVNKMLEEEVKECKDSEISRDEQVMDYYGLKGIYPFLNDELVDFALNVPVELKITSDYKKWVLRLAAKKIGVPEIAWKRPKSALQYGSGVHKLIENKARKDYRDVEQVKQEGYHGPIEKWLHQIWRGTI